MEAGKKEGFPDEITEAVAEARTGFFFVLPRNEVALEGSVGVGGGGGFSADSLVGDDSGDRDSRSVEGDGFRKQEYGAELVRMLGAVAVDARIQFYEKLRPGHAELCPAYVRRRQRVHRRRLLLAQTAGVWASQWKRSSGCGSEREGEAQRQTAWFTQCTQRGTSDEDEDEAGSFTLSERGAAAGRDGGEAGATEMICCGTTAEEDEVLDSAARTRHHCARASKREARARRTKTGTKDIQHQSGVLTIELVRIKRPWRTREFRKKRLRNQE